METNQPFYELPLSIPAGGSRDVRVLRDIAYQAQDGGAARMDIYLPAGEAPEEGYAPLLFIHGGPLPPPGERPWPKEWRVFQDYGSLAAQHGLAGVVINHRYIGYEGLLQARADVQQALNFLAERGSAYGLNGEKLAVWAFSGAGMLLTDLLQDGVYAPDCVIAFYPMLDLTHIPQAVEVYGEEQLMALSPLSQIDRMPQGLPMFIARAGLDRPGLNRALDTFVKQALYHNLDLELHNLPRAAHSFDMFDPSDAVQDTIARGFEFVKNELSAFSAQLSAEK